MFYSITGKVVFTDTSSCAVEAGGVAFRCFTSFNTLRKIGSIGETTTLYTYLSVREDALDLFGFCDTNELDCFKLLIAITGVGPKAALAILSVLTPDKLAQAVASGDVRSITAAQGIGPKIAQRIISELKDKLAPFAGRDSSVLNTDSADAVSGTVMGKENEVIEALMSLGFSRSEAAIAAAKTDPALPVDEMIKQALFNMGGRF